MGNVLKSLKRNSSRTTTSRTADYLAADHDGACDEWHVRVLLESVVERDDVKDVHQLALVLVDAFHLHVEHRRRVHRHLVLLLYVRRKLHLVLLKISNAAAHAVVQFCDYRRRCGSKGKGRYGSSTCG